MKFYSRIFKAKTVVSIFITIWIIILILITINHGLSCVNSSGCLKKWCKANDTVSGDNIIRSKYSFVLKTSCKKSNRR